VRACLSGRAAGTAGHVAEVIVVDDGSQPPVETRTLPLMMGLKLLRLEGLGPAAARNAGARLGADDVVLFTDDDTVPAPGCVMAALNYLDHHPESVAVTGPVRSAARDPLYQQSVESLTQGQYWTCNIVYRRSGLEETSGFRADVFTHAHAEDRDLAIRAMRFGHIGFAPAMEVTHTPRAIGVRTVLRQARWARDDLVPYAVHPARTFAFTLPTRLALVVGACRTWLRYGVSAGAAPSLRRAIRAVVLGTADTAATVWAVATTPSSGVLRDRYLASPTGHHQPEPSK
jgi:GT2 family glycosyltransferase